MQLKLSLSFLLNVILTFVIVFFLDVIIALAIFWGGKEDIFSVKNIQDLINSYQQEIYFTGDRYTLLESAKKRLFDNDSYIQLLDENGAELFSYNKPITVPTKYEPFDLINTYKYFGVYDNKTVFIQKVEVNDRELSYLVGMPMNRYKRYVVNYEGPSLRHSIKKYIMLIYIFNLLVVILVGFFSSLRISRKTGKIIHTIKLLTDGDYSIDLPEYGLYKTVNRNLNSLAETLENARREREENIAIRDEWLSNITHDFKTPIASIKGYSELLDSDYDNTPEEVRHYGKVINKKVEYLNDLVNDFNLDLKLRGSNNALQRDKNDLVAFLRESVIDVLNSDVNGSIHLDFETMAEKYPAYFDKKLLKRAMNNIIYNSIKHNPKGTPIKVKAIPEGKKFYIIVADKGVGMSKNDQQHIFDRYYRGRATCESSEGSGLGMAITYSIVKAHGWEIDVNSKIEKGTTITITVL